MPDSDYYNESADHGYSPAVISEEYGNIVTPMVDVPSDVANKLPDDIHAGLMLPDFNRPRPAVGLQGAGPSGGYQGMTDEYLRRLIAATEKRYNFRSYQVSVPLASNGHMTLVRPKEVRAYFLLANTSANSVFLAFDNDSTLNAISLLPGFVYEPYAIPQNDMYMYTNAIAPVNVTLILGY
jgi:hypothetical protein